VAFLTRPGLHSNAFLATDSRPLRFLAPLPTSGFLNYRFLKPSFGCIFYSLLRIAGRKPRLRSRSRSRAASCSVWPGGSVFAAQGPGRALAPVHLVAPLLSLCVMSPLIPKRPIVDQNFVLCQPLRPARKRAAAGRGAHMKHVAPHKISGPKPARPHGGIPSPGAEQRRGQWVVSGQGFT
jgi:hypothetical protein